jgi:hypothetical protein
MGNSTAYLRYNTVSYKWHSGAYAEIISATNTGPYKVVVSGEDAMCIGETISVTASGGSESNYTWSGYGGLSLSGTTSNSALVTGISPGFASVSATDVNRCRGVKEIIVLQPNIGKASPLADRTLHPDAARKPLVLRQTLPDAWHGQMQLNLTGAVAYWTPTGGVPIALSSTFFANEQLPRTIYLEGDGCGIGEASFSIAGSGGCATNTPLQIFGANATLAGVAEADEESPGGFIADRTVHTNAPRTILTLEACGPYGSPGNLILTWDSSIVQIYTAPSGGSALTQFVTPFHGFNGTNLYVEGIAPGTTTLSWTYSAQANCTDNIQVSIIKIDMITPAGDPVGAPSDSGDGQNEFTYSPASPGVLTMNLKARVTPSGIADQIKDQVLFTVDGIGASTLAWDAANPGGKPTASGDDLLATVTFTGLPANNSDFGAKKAAVYFSGNKQDEESYEVFYTKTASNHPSDSSTADWPNWMYYWSQTVVPLGSPTPAYKYGTASGYGSFTPGTTEIWLGSNNGGSYNAPYGLNNPLTGIDNFAWVVIHESQHYKDWCDLWSNNYTDWFYNHQGNAGPGDDKDADMISNSTEDMNLNGVYDAGDLYDWETYNTPTAGRPVSILNDFEDWNCQRHKDATGDHSKDWGNPGMQHNTKDKYDD